jgi:integrase
LWCAYYLRGEEIRESTGTADPKEAAKYLKRRLREVGADLIGAKKFVGPQAEKIRIACGITDARQRVAECGCLCCALERDLRLRNKLNPPNSSLLKQLHRDFALQPASSLKSEKIDAYIECRLAEDYAPASVNRITQLLGQSFNLAIKQKRLATAPYIRHLAETGNVRQGFYTAAEFDAIVSGLPEYLKDFAHFGYLTGTRSNQIKTLLWDDIDGDVILSRAENVKNRKAHAIELDADLKQVIERRQTARQAKRPDGTVVLSRFVFHRDGEPIGDFRKAWQTACVMAGLGQFLCRDCEVILEAGRQCPSCGQKWTKNVQPKYVGRLFHDFRRTAVRDMVRAGVPQSVAMSISGHSTTSMFQRYDITDGRDQREAFRALKAYRDQQASAECDQLVALPLPSESIN